MKEQIDWRKLSDESLIQWVVQSNIQLEEAAKAELYKRYYLRVLNRCLRLNIPADEAVELTNDIFIKAFKHLGFLSNQTSGFRPWLMAIARNHCISLHRKNKSTIISLNRYQELNPAFDHMDEEDTVEMKEINVLMMEAAFQQLTFEEQEILNAFYLKGLSQKAICDQLQIGSSALKMKLKRAKERALRNYLSLPR